MGVHSTPFTIPSRLPASASMSDRFFEHPILNSPYEKPLRHWELGSQGQPTQRIIESRRVADFITPISKPKKQQIQSKQLDIEFNEFNEEHGVSTKDQPYDASSINHVRTHVVRRRSWPNPTEGYSTNGDRREHPLGSYTLDFVCIELKLNIEIDGKDHLTEEGKRHDVHRDAYLRDLGYTVLRINGFRVTQDPMSVRQEIEEIVRRLRENVYS